MTINEIRAYLKDQGIFASWQIVDYDARPMLASKAVAEITLLLNVTLFRLRVFLSIQLSSVGDKSNMYQFDFSGVPSSMKTFKLLTSSTKEWPV